MMKTLRDHAGVALPQIKTWQAIDTDEEYKPNNPRTFPLIDIRASPPITGDDGVTQRVNISILIATSCNDDPNHIIQTGWYEAVAPVVDKLYSQFRAGGTGAEYSTFTGYVSGKTQGQTPAVSIGGFEHGEPLIPYEDQSAYFIGMNFIIHFARSDY